MSARLEELSPLLALPLDCQAPGGGFHGCSKPRFPHLLSENKQSCGIDRLSHPWADWTQEGNPWRENRVCHCFRVSSLLLSAQSLDWVAISVSFPGFLHSTMAGVLPGPMIQLHGAPALAWLQVEPPGVLDFSAVTPACHIPPP